MREYTHTFILFLKSLDYKNLPHAQRVSHDFLSLLRSLLSSRSLFFFACLLYVPHFSSRNNRKKNSEKEKVYFVFFSGLGGSLSLFFTAISFALSVLFSFFLLQFRVRVGSRSTATRASPALSRLSAYAGGKRRGCKERGRGFRG